MTELTDRAYMKVQTFSGGMRRKLEIVRAFIHHPLILFLDEPTIGLDPHQIRLVRQLIKNLAGDHTVLISTHILPEVEMMCSRIMIMLGGRILASDTPENLQKQVARNGQIIAEIAAPAADLNACWAQMAEVEYYDVSPAEGEFQRCALTARDGHDLRPQIFALVQKRGWRLRELTRSRHSLEDIYVQVTKPNEEEE